MAIWRKVIVSGSNAELNSLYVGNAVTASIVSSSQFTGSLFGTASYVTGSIFTSNNLVLSSSYALTASYAANVAAMQNLTFGEGLSAVTYNGSSPVSVSVSGAADLTNNVIVKWNDTDNKFAPSQITDNGTTVSLTNLSVTGDLTVAGTASFTNSQNLLITDQFVALSSGSTSLKDSGFVVISSQGGSGSAFFLEADNTGTYGRWGVAYSLNPSASNAVADELMVTTKISAANPSLAPTWGGSVSGSGNMWINTGDGSIWIYA